jgi:PAS domain S-box-containing protein
VNAFPSSENPLELLRIIADQCPVGVQIFDVRGYSVYVNAEFERMYGGAPPPSYCVLKDSLAEATGVLELVQRAFAGENVTTPAFWYDPRELRQLGRDDMAYIERVCKGCVVQTKFVPHRRVNGEISHVVSFHQDVTDSFFKDQELANSRTLMTNILDQTSAIVYLKNLEGKYLFVNKKFLEVFGRKPGEVLGRTDFDFIPEEIARTWRANDEQVVRNGAHLEAEESARHFDGTVNRYVSVKFPLTDSLGKVIGVGGISSDITRIHSLERELQSAKRMEALGLFAGGVTHNFNNLLNIIVLAVELLLRRRGRVPILVGNF